MDGPFLRNGLQGVPKKTTIGGFLNLALIKYDQMTKVRDVVDCSSSI